jgi:hypothetical protein
MKRSRTVVLSLLSATALGLAGCESRKELKTCVDRDNVVQDDDRCGDIDRRYPFGGGHFHWIYGGNSRDGTYVSGHSVMYGGSNAPEPGVETATPHEAAAHGGTISEGHVSFHGFGSHGEGGHAHSGEGGHGGGHGGAGE